MLTIAYGGQTMQTITKTLDSAVRGFTVDVYKAEEADDTFSFWITEEAYEAIG
jgi:hypothetical protein